MRDMSQSKQGFWLVGFTSELALQAANTTQILLKALPEYLRKYYENKRVHDHD